MFCVLVPGSPALDLVDNVGQVSTYMEIQIKEIYQQKLDV